MGRDDWAIGLFGIIEGDVVEAGGEVLVFECDAFAVRVVAYFGHRFFEVGCWDGLAAFELGEAELFGAFEVDGFLEDVGGQVVLAFVGQLHELTDEIGIDLYPSF